jgi:hypothetical protein
MTQKQENLLALQQNPGMNSQDSIVISINWWAARTAL